MSIVDVLGPPLTLVHSGLTIDYMGVSKYRGTQNGWLIMENPIKMDDFGGPPLFLETPISIQFDEGADNY